MNLKDVSSFGYKVARSWNITLCSYISVAEKHKTKFRLMTKINKYKQIIEFNPTTAIEYSSCYK